MTSMKFANILLETNPRSVAYPALYCRSDHPVIFNETQGEWEMYGAGTFDFSTYFNSLSVMKLRKYTSATSFMLHLELKGAACEVQQTMGDVFAHDPLPVEGASKVLSASDDWQVVDLPLTITDDMVIVGFLIKTEGAVAIRNSYYELGIDGELNDVELVLSTTTFKKEAFIERNIGLVKDKIIKSGDSIADHFHMYVIDNGRTLDAEKLSGNRVQVVPNDNVGGAGGFTRGMITAMEQIPKATNILLMDDDVAVSPESIKRTYNLLRILKPEHRNDMISGAMLNYEVGEDQWEDIGNMTQQGTFAGCKPPLRLTLFEDLVYNEIYTPTKWQRNNMYAAWWYCCIPISVIEKNGLPLPVFVRCDDAEYGIRCKTGFITMNGLCVWHMSFFERYNAAVERYQTTRNTMIAQATCGMAPKADFMYELHNNIRLELKKFCSRCGKQTVHIFPHTGGNPCKIRIPGLRAFVFSGRYLLRQSDFCLSGRGDLYSLQLRLIHTKPVPCLRGQSVDGHIIFFFHILSSLYPMLPFISRRIRLFISTAYSNGSSFDTLSAKPLTIMALASSSEMPRDIR